MGKRNAFGEEAKAKRKGNGTKNCGGAPRQTEAWSLTPTKNQEGIRHNKGKKSSRGEAAYLKGEKKRTV